MEKTLRSIPELEGVPARDIKYLASVAALVSFKKGEIIFHADEKAGHAWFLVSGKAVLGNASQNGNQSATCIVKSGDLFCCIPIMDFGTYTSTAVCTEKATAIRIPIVEFNKVISKSAETYRGFVARFCSRLREVECRLCNQAEPAAHKITAVLKQYQQRSGSEFPLTRAEIAQLTGLTVETVIRTLSALKKRNVIGGSRGAIKILKPGAL